MIESFLAKKKEERSPNIQQNLLQSLLKFYRENKIKTIMPIIYKGKAPREKWEKYEYEPFPKKQLKMILTHNIYINLGVICGEVNNNLVVIDLDKTKAEDVKKILIGEVHELRDTFTVKTGSGGYHFYLFADYAMSAKRVDFIGIKDFHLDMQRQGTYVVAPPSMHPNGNYYRTRVQNALLLINNGFEKVFSLTTLDVNEWMKLERSGFKFLYIEK